MKAYKARVVKDDSLGGTPQIQTPRRQRTAAEAGSPPEPQRGDRYLAWGVSPRDQSQEYGKPRRGDRKIQPRVDLSPLRGSILFSAQYLGLTPQAIHLSRLRRSTRDDTWPRDAEKKPKSSSAATTRQAFSGFDATHTSMSIVARG